MNMNQFIHEHKQLEGGGQFQLESRKMLEVKVDGEVWAKAGTMVAYRGNLRFAQKSGGLGKWLKSKVTGEGTLLMQVSGDGRLYLADQGKEVQVLQLESGEKLSVNGSDILAFEQSIAWDIRMLRQVAGWVGGGLFNVELSGPGYVAFTTHGRPLVLQTPVITDPQATVAWSGHLQPQFKTDINIRTVLGRSSGETFQMHFSEPGGFVVVQPYEESVQNS